MKGTSMKRIILLAFAAAALAACGSSGSSGTGSIAPLSMSSVPTEPAITTDVPLATDTPTPTDSVPPTPVANKVGESETLSDPTGDVAKLTVTSLRTATYDPDTEESASGGLFVVVSVSATGLGSPYSISPSDFYVTGRDGAHSENLTFSSHWGAPLETATLHKGERIHGVMVFDASKGSNHGKIYYSPNSSGDPIGYWTY